MSVDKDTVARIAHLARIKLADDQLEPLSRELSNILSWVEKLSEVDTENVDPMTSVVETTLPQREDVVNDGNCRDDVLSNAPDAQHGFFAVPKVIE
ncbi:MAG: Asp-tRNA(Asn)/Glu-tRNA(Gln) amidotransferase subunit GatC [Alphaproteobacteria bacterium]|nr:Asp-tRNA(Asn)/Glu-tRNA(Gln) amidotransferase subunit GatC [Alphaproteobacteria bacterium]